MVAYEKPNGILRVENPEKAGDERRLSTGKSGYIRSYPPDFGPRIHKFSINSGKTVDNLVDDVENVGEWIESEKSDSGGRSLFKKTRIG